MTLYGMYPFLVYVANTFKPDSDVIFKVKCHRFRSYYDPQTKNFIIETSVTTPKEHSIEAGDRLAFPLYFGDELLEISLDLEKGVLPTDDFLIAAGRKAKCYPNDALGRPQEDTFLAIEKDKSYGGGIWNVSKEETDWTLTIKKYGADPESDDVVIGSPPPA